jgi:glycosyltransferase involved in cell wall biosynthesis
VTTPLISAIVPSYNAARFLPEAIASIQAQNYPAIEILLIDDGSTDNTPEIAAGYGSAVRYFQKPNGGAASARNLGLREARGEIFAFLDADDQWPERKLAVQLPRLAAADAPDVVSGRIRYIALPGALMLDYRFEGPDQTVAHIHLGAALYRRSAFQAVGPFDESLHVGEDQDWFLRAREQGLKIVVMRDVTLHYRLHDSNITRGASAEKLELIQVVRKSLERRRRDGPAKELPAWSSFDEPPKTE